MIVRKPTVFALLGAVVLFGAACSEEQDHSPAAADAGTAAFECTAERAGWEQCTDGKVQWCHVLEGMQPHFHWGADCTSLGLECVGHGEHQASCLDRAQSCSAGEHRCDQNTAYNCVDGAMAVEPCGSAKLCHDEQAEARCEAASAECGGHGRLQDGACVCAEGYQVDPADPTNCLSEVDFPTESCQLFGAAADPVAPVTAFADFGDAHVELEHPFEVALPAGSAAYVHFDAPAAGEYVIFLSVTGAFDALLDADETEQLTSGAVPNGKCAELIGDHYHADLTPQGADPAMVIRFKAGEARSVKVLVRRKDAAECGGHGHLEQGACVCEEGYKVDPAAPDQCIAKGFPELSCEQFLGGTVEEVVVSQTFEGVFSPDAHAELETPIAVTLPEQTTSYVHFPTLQSGEYVIFLGTAGVFDALLDKDGNEVLTSGAVPNGFCPESITDHYHAELSYSGDGTTPVPAVIRFKPVASQQLRFLVRIKR